MWYGLAETAPRPWAPRRCSHGPAKDTVTQKVRRGSSHKKSERAKILAKLEPAKAYLGTGQTLKLVDQYPDAHPVVKKALNIIEEGYASDLSQSDVAERLGITAEYFSYIFAKSTGKSYTKFLRAYRINKAMDILSKDPDKKNDVCLMVGFRDQKYFAKCFKEVTGKPLSEYLQEIGE